MFRSWITLWFCNKILSEQSFLFTEVSFEAADFETDDSMHKHHYSAVSEGGFHWLDPLCEYAHH